MSATLRSRLNIQQRGFSRLWDGYETDAEAKAARDAEYRRLKAAGHWVKRSVLKNQLKKYDGLGQPNGSSCDVYYLTIRYNDEGAAE